MYVKPACPNCQAAREHLAAEGVAVQQRDAIHNQAWKAELMGYTNGRGIVPTLIRDGKRPQVGSASPQAAWLRSPEAATTSAIPSTSAERGT